MKKQLLFIATVLIVVFCLSAFFIYSYLFGAPKKGAPLEQFTVSLSSKSSDAVNNIFKQGFVKSTLGLNFILRAKEVKPGGYMISRSMNAWQLAQTLEKGPSLVWVVIPEGLRKEQITEILSKSLDWSDSQKSDWILNITALKSDYFEGVYFPETYLIPKSESPADVAQRLINKFNEKFAPYAKEAVNQNIKWTTALKVAAIVQREGLGKEDMPLIAGIIWNRLEQNMNLQIDATVQYAKDNKVHFLEGQYVSSGSWWSPIATSDKKIDSPYNTYLYSGLGPYPIDNPGIEAIDAALNSTDTKCLYYLHDKSGQIHCAKTFQEHRANIEKYLK